MNIEHYGTGRRKTAIARTRLFAGTGQIVINDRSIEDYFPRPSLQMIIYQPLVTSNKMGNLDIRITVEGGGMTGQATAVRLGIARALINLDPELRPALKKSGFLSRDARKKERKKYGQRGARAKFQYSKR
ncbi:30S ribosomal subunit protein S9 [Desulfovibrionales bacterium]